LVNHRFLEKENEKENERRENRGQAFRFVSHRGSSNRHTTSC
jgi:hypothetical protein